MYRIASEAHQSLTLKSGGGKHNTYLYTFSGTSARQRDLLLKFKDSFDNFDDVAKHHNFTGWSSQASQSPCNWTGVGCSGSYLSISLRYLGLKGVPPHSQPPS